MDRSTILSIDNSLKDLIHSFIAELSHHFEKLRLPRVQRNATYFAHVYTKASVDNSAYNHEQNNINNKLILAANTTQVYERQHHSHYHRNNSGLCSGLSLPD